MQVRYRYGFVPTPGYRFVSWCVSLVSGVLFLLGVDLVILHRVTTWLPGEAYSLWWGGIVALLLAIYLLFLADDNGLQVTMKWFMIVVLGFGLLLLVPT